MKRQEAHPNPKLLKWAREYINCSVELAAKKIGIYEIDIVKIEAGELYPTFSQLRRFSELYKRPLSVF